MDDLASSIDPDDLMDLDEAEGSDLDEEEDELIDDRLPSPFQFPSSAPPSTATSAASSPHNDDFPQPFNFSGKPLNIKRGRGRPRREGGKPAQRRQSLGGKVRKLKPPGFPKTPKKFKNFLDFESFSYLTPSPGDELPIIDPETGSLIFTEREKPAPVFEELPFFPEQWPGKVCAFCNLAERSQLGQGEMLRLIRPDGFIPQRIVSDVPENLSMQIPERELGDKSPRGPVTCRRQKSFNKCRHPSLTSEYVDELTIIGYIEQPDVSGLFDVNGYFYVHRSCTLWSNGVMKNENSVLENVGPVVLQSSSRKCSFCSHFGASISCKVGGCSKTYHFPCATASGAFQVLNLLSLYCSSHMGQVASDCENIVCYTCKAMGDIANLMYCSTCGEHYHGCCVGLAQLPGVRAGWQCRKCRVCQVCRVTGDESKLMSCEQCDKIYHSTCQRPIVTSIPKYGWKCRCCRVCGDCGSRTPGAGLSSRWHAHYTVCDSCYQQRNKGYCCPLCHRAYRAHAHREMVQCTSCRRFVHGTCDPDADLVTYQQRKEGHPEYDYVCPVCKNLSQPGQLLSKRNSTDDISECLSSSQESPFEDNVAFDFPFPIDPSRTMGLGKGKPYSASKIAKKRLGISNVMPGRPKGVGKGPPGKVGFMKRQRMTEFGRKRGPKAKMRGVFGVPGVGLQRPVSDGKSDEEPGVENRLVLCSAKDKFVLTQDICVMCGALGTDQEGCLIACVQCGQCYHPYCVNVKVTKVILQKGWRCLDCTVCEGCGQRNDESRLILCDDCDISFHIYCMDPPLDYVPHGNWKCKWCAICQSCGATDPGFNCSWMNSFSECGPCASHVTCPSCSEPYSEGDLIIQCVQCERWLHGACDSIKTEDDAEKCAEEGYNCMLCRPRDVPPPHLVPSATCFKPPTPTKSPEMKSNNNYFVDGVYLSESGHNLIKSLSLEQHGTRKKRKKLATVQEKEAGIMATIESVVAGSRANNLLEDGSAKLELVDVKEEPQEIYKEGMIWTKDDGPPPEGFTLFTMDSGVGVLRRKRQRNLQKLGIGGFLVRVRGIRGQDNDDIDVLPGQSNPDVPLPVVAESEKPRRKPIRRKPKSKLAETFPPYLQEAFFGRDLLDSTKDMDSSSSDEEKHNLDHDKTIQLTQDEIRAVAAVNPKRELGAHPLMDNKHIHQQTTNKMPIVPKEEEEDSTEDLKDVLALPGDLLDNELVNTFMNAGDGELVKNAGSLEALTDEADLGNTAPGTKDTKDELSDILGPNFNLESMPNINSKDVEDIFKGVLTDDSQESQESNVFPMQNNNNNSFPANPPQNIAQHQVPPAVRPTSLPTVSQSNMNSPLNFPPQSPYQSEYSNSPQFSPAFSEPPSPWVAMNDGNDLDGSTAGAAASTYNQRSSEKMKADEGLGNGATISAVLYANINHPEWKTEFPNWNERYKQILKKWRTLSQEQKGPYLQQARDNRSALRMKKQQQSQMNKDTSNGTSAASKPSTPVGATVVAAVAVAPSSSIISSTQVPPAIVAPVSEVCTQQSRPTPSLTTASTSSVSVSPPLTPSPTTQQQFTVHGQFPGPGDHCGPAPNVTVNPLYQPPPPTTTTDQVSPPTAPTLRPAVTQQTAPSASDQQIRVLTPSEIMRTLPSLCQENYEPQPPPDQEKVALQHKSAREAEQERQWKHLQALRQQQAQQQQHVIHEQRVQARVQRQISDPSQPFAPESPQEASPVTPPQTPRPLLNMGINIKSPTFVHPSQTVVRPTTPSQPPIEFESDPYTKPPSTPKPQPLPLPQPQFQPRPQTDPYSQQPGTPRPSFPIQRPNFQGARVEGPEINRQLRDLLQRQQFKKLDEHLLAGKGQQRVWPPSQAEAAPETETNTNLPTMNDSTFRHPLPPGNTRPRLPLPVGAHKPALLGLRIQQIDPRMQGIDPRIRPLLQQQQQQRLLQAGAITQQQQFASAGTVRFATGAIRPASVEQYEQLLQRQPQTAFQARGVDAQVAPRLPSVPQMQVPIQRAAQAPIMPQAGNGENNAPSAEQEIPDNVTAELEKLEQETGTMVELQGVSDILGGLGEDDDELLAEVGADFNILEYADTEALPGEKTNILDLELEEDPIKNDRKAKADAPKSGQNPQVNPAQMIKKETTQTPMSQPQNMGNIHPPPLAISQSQSTPQVATGTVSHLTPQQIYQQMLHQVQQAAAHGRPMLPGSKLQTPDGIIGIVTPNNNIQLQVPQSYHQKLLLMQQLQNQKLQMRVGQAVPRMMTAPPNQQGMHPNAVGINPAPRMGLPAPPPPPPPYQKPPPPYPGSATPQQQPQMGLRMGPVHLPPGHMHPMQLQGKPLHPHLQRRPLLLEEQPLLLEDLLEQEKREQEKQNQTQTSANTQPELTSPTTSNVESESPALLSDHDFERLKADVFSSGSVAINPNARQGQVPPAMVQGNWAQTQNRPIPTPTPQPTIEIKVQTFTANLLPPPPLPPENIATEQDKQKQIVYEQWLAHQNNVLAEQLKYYDTEVQKLRKIRKSLNSKQRQLRKSGGQLTDADATELQRISSEQSVLQKHLESSRKLSRQHNLLIQEYRNKQQAKQGPAPGQSPLLLQQNSSPLGPPSSSPIHHSSMSQSPMMSPSASPLTQHNSPMHSPGPLISHSPGSVQGVLQSPGSINNMSPLQPSRIGTPLSQSEGSPGNAASPGQVCLPPPAPRMTSPQHKRVVTSPVGYSGDVRPGTPQMRFVRTPDHSRVARLPSPMSGFPQKPGTPSPLGSPPAQQIMQKHLTIDGQDINILNSPRTAALIQQRNLIRQHLAQQQHNQQGILQPQPLTPQQHQMMVQQQQQLAKQQQLAQIQAQIQAQRLNQQQQQANPPSPMPPKSPLVQQMMSPHSMPASPMPPKSPMTQYGNNQQGPPSSPVTRNFHQPPNSPMGHQYQPPSSPMPRSPMIGQIQSPLSMRRPPSSPASVEPQPVRTPFSMHDNDTGGGGNPYNNPIPAPPGFGRYGYFKLGLRGGSPMWGFGRGAKRIPTPPVTNKDDKNETPVKPKKESHLSKVSILKRKSPAKTNLQSFAVSKVGSLVSTDYNEFDDSSCTPPVTPPPSTSRLVQKTGKKIPEETRVHSPEEKEIMDYDDDNNTVVSGEVSLSSTAQQNDGDDIAVMETFSQNDLGEPMSSPLESDQIPDEYVLFPGNMVVDISGEAQYSDKEEEGEEEYTSGNMHVVIRSPTTSDDELIMQNKSGKKFMSRQDEESNFEESEIVIIDPSVKSPEEQISTKEDFEELIDEDSKKDNVIKTTDVIHTKHINEIHKYAAFFSPKTEASTSVANFIANSKKISLITTPVVHTKSEILKNPDAKVVSVSSGSKVTNIILHSGMRTNVLSVPKLVTTGSSAITIVSASSSPITSMLPSSFTVPVISASAVRQLPNVKVIDKPSSSISLTTHENLPKKIFENEPPETKIPEVAKPTSEEVKSDSEKKDTSSVKNQIISQSSAPVIIHNTPELKMTAQVIQETQSGMQITARTESSDGFEATDDTKSVVISIPSPTPSQEQMLDNIALQALENRRRDGNGIPGEFESFEDVLDMIENITGEPPTVIEGGNEKHEQKVEEKAKNVENNPPKTPAVPQLSPLSQPTDLTTNMANASQQLRSLLSSLHTGTITSTSNVETVVKSVTNVTLAAPPIVTSRVVQQPISNSVILGSKKTVVTVAKPNQSLSFLTSRSTSEIQLMPEHPMLPRVSSIGTSANDNTRKATYSLTEMLQSHPAATSTTKISVDTITAASLLGSAVGLSRSGFSTSLVQAQPHVVVSPQISNVQTSTATFKPVTSNLLHTHLTKVIRSKSVEELKEIKPEEIKIENIEIANETKPDVAIKQEPTGCKLSIISTIPSSREDSQNVLLKKLLQNTACASTQTPQPVTSAAPITVASPMQFNSSNLENQLKASTPTLTSILPPVAKETPVVAQAKPPVPQRTPVMTRETSFVSNPSVQQSATQQLHIDIKKCMPPSRTPSRDELLSPPTPRSSCSQDSSLQTPPLIIKKEPGGSTQQMMQEVKKEFIDENSQHSEVSDISSCNVQMKEEIDSLDATEKMLQDKEMIKKMKRRMYQQKRRQNQINKDVGGQPKKRPRKSSRVDEDYDTYIDGVMAQLRNLPPMVVSEPILNRNFNILPVFGGDFAKLSASDYDTRYGELRGDYGNAVVPGYSNFYNTQPYGDLEPLPEKPPTSTQRGFYDNEFALIKFDSDEDKRFDVFCREDTPDSVISSSSPECPVLDPPHKFLGLRLIDEDEDEEEEMDVSRMRLSPVVPIVTPIPIRLKDTGGQYLKDYTDDKENIGREVCLKSKFGQTPTTPLKDSGNVTVTLTLTSSAAEDIMGVLRDLANILHIPAPTSYQIVERTSTPPSQKLGLYRTKGKDGKEGAPIDIQSILNGEAKFCKHCDVVILNNMIRKKVSELPFLSKDSELLSDGDELFFCSSTCYMQFALMHRSPSISEDKAAAIIDHLCQKDKSDVKGKRPFLEGIESKRHFVDNMEMELHCYKKSVNVESPFFTRPSDVIKIRKYDEPRIWRNTRYKAWIPGCLQPPSKHKKPTDKEIMELLYRMGITVTPSKLPEDTRKCMFCQGMGDGVADGPARLLNFDVDKWVHLNCGLWSDGVYETVNGALMNLDNSLQQSLTQTCIHCNKLGATIRCFKTRCSNVYHLSCAVKDGCVFYKNKTTYCTVHIPKSEKDNELTTLSVSRRVYVNRDENRQVAAVMHHSDTNNLLRVGNLIFLSVGQLLPHQLQNFHTANYIYPIGYKIIRFYWSMRRLNKRCRYICSIQDVLGRPEFRVVIQEPPAEDVEFKHLSPKGVWQPILEQIALMRRQNQCVQVFPKFVSGEDLFGLTEPAVVRVLESLPGIETLTDYKFKYGRNPLLELPLAINPTGAARTEPRLRNQLHWKRPHTQRTSGGSSQRPLFGPSPSAPSPSAGLEVACPYSKQFVHSKSSQYKKMKQEWRNNVFLARSKIQGLGLYAARDLEKHTMVIEYIGEIIRSELAETREKKYEAKNRGIYMFRLDEERVVDATLCGGLARYINHSCNPNCVAETVEVDRDCRIIIFAKRRIQRGEELAYDYKFDIEDDQHKISCMCGAPNCRKWMN